MRLTTAMPISRHRDSARPARARRRLAYWAALLVVGLVVAACTPAEKASGQSSSTTVGADGFALAVEGVTVTAPSGTVDVGTTARLSTISAPIPANVSEFASVSGTAIELSLEGKQPVAPITAVFDVPPGTDSSSVFILGEDASTATGTSFIESAVSSDGTQVTGTITHLSWFAAVVLDKKNFGEAVGQWINQALGTSSPAPACVAAIAPELSFTAVDGNVAWPCASVTNVGVDFQLQSNSGLVWQVKTDPVASYEPLTATTVSGLFTAVLANSIQSRLAGDSVVLSLESLRGHIGARQSQYTIALKVEPGLSQISTIMFGLGMILPTKWVNSASNAECLVGVLQTATNPVNGSSLRSILECVGTAMQGTAGALLGILLTGPALLATQLEGLGREITGKNAIQFYLEDSRPVVPDSCTALFSPSIYQAMQAQGWRLNEPYNGRALADYAHMGLTDADLREAVNGQSEALTCYWFSTSDHYGMTTRILEMPSEAAAAVLATLQSLGWDREDFSGGTRFFYSGSNSEGEYGESHFVRGNTWIVSKWSGFAPDGYTRDIVKNLDAR